MVHYSAAHLMANLAGAALIGLLGGAARITLPMAGAWAAAWPLTHLGLLAEPQLAHYGGLSGVLHAAVAVVAVHLMRGSATLPRRVGWALLAGLSIKVLSESPWKAPSFDLALGIWVAPVAHACGALSGAACALAAVLLVRLARQRQPV